jgi:hypothetical protein
MDGRSPRPVVPGRRQAVKHGPQRESWQFVMGSKSKLLTLEQVLTFEKKPSR